MQVGVQKKEGNLFQDMYSRWQEEQSHGHQRSKVQLHSRPQNRSIWLFFTPSRNRFGFIAFSRKSGMTLATKTVSTPIVKAPLRSPTTQSTMLARSTLIFSTTLSETEWRREQPVWSIAQRRTWWQMI